MTKKLSELKEDIIKKSEERAETIRSRAEKAKKRTIRAAKRQADRILRKAEKREEDNFEREKRKIKYELEIQSRKKKLTIEQNLLKDLKKELKNKLQALHSEGKMDKWIKTQIEDIINKSDGQFTLLCNQDNEKKYKKICENMDIKIKSDNIDSGFILRSKVEEYDFRFDTLAENLVETNKHEVLKTLQVTEGDDG